MSVESVKRPPSGPRAELKRQAILRAARELFLREGFGVGMDTIAAEAGVSKVTVYNHFGSKEALFTAVITTALDEPLAGESSAALEGLAEAGDLRTALVEAARTWVHAVRANDEVTALRNLVAAELHRFPELGEAWRHRGTESHHPAVAGALRTLADRGRLVIPDLQVAIIQFYGLLVFPHMVFSSYGTQIDEDLTDRLITSGVDMFLGHYSPRST
ncbi:TetR/AcrR family transcriptional regulator [Streptomyces sp. SID5643]|uniref:TetR/AcrR family transcriptional regulator n=1 Tax=Streptomyces sp. SID5643 TaxID=2690307 RepID=UPI00136F1E05|nr:TetR/AcrR family transcriptional regulator [Streptomyces sp. SID5643]MZF83680.1 TetR family transcriptional regulator [Streptomyces sp. SID5643]